MKKIFLILLLVQFTLFGESQDKEYAKSIIDTLCAPGMHGRGYVKNGKKIAAKFIENEYKKLELKSFKDSYKQMFFIDMNTFPYNTIVKIDNKELIPGKDYFVGCGSNKVSGTYSLIWLDKSIVCKKRKLKKFIKGDYSNKFIVIDKTGITDELSLAILAALHYQNLLHAKGIITLHDSNMVWTVSDGAEVSEHTYLDCYRNGITPESQKITIDISNRFVKNYETQNVIGYVEGKLKPDSFIIFSAHYDHLGRMGNDTYFPGANDNASGTAMIIDLAKYYSKPQNQPDYSIAFIAYSAEEAGLFGSTYFADNPLIPLKKIKFVINLDMVGTGSEGIKVVNGKILTKQFEALKKLNDEKLYVEKVKAGGEAANSDHHPLYSKGVDAIFIFTTGKEHLEYHTINDKAEVLPLTEYEDFFKLMLDFVKTF